MVPGAHVSLHGLDLVGRCRSVALTQQVAVLQQTTTSDLFRVPDLHKKVGYHLNLESDCSYLS